MSWEANTWAVKQRMKLPQEQLVLIVLGNCADADAIAFSTWPGRDHWWGYLCKITRLSRSSLFRHINTIVSLGLASRSMIVLSDGSKRPTIALNLEATFDIESEEERYFAATQRPSRDESHHETHDDADSIESENTNNTNNLQAENDDAETESHHETVAENAPLSPTHGTDRVPPVGLHIDSSKSCSKESPPTPQRGAEPSDGFEEFKKAWARPIERLSVALTVWSHIATIKRGKAITAARGYWAWHGKQTVKPPPPMSAQTFLREESGWDQWLPYAPDADGVAPAIANNHPLGTPAGKAIVELHELAGCDEALRSYMIRNGAVSYRLPVNPRLLALADAGPKSDWVTLSRQQAAAWEGFLRETVTVAVRKHLKESDRAPWPWPPRKDGTLSTTGPPSTELMTADDLEHFDK